MASKGCFVASASLFVLAFAVVLVLAGNMAAQHVKGSYDGSAFCCW
jgi:hypothetical protein